MGKCCTKTLRAMLITATLPVAGCAADPGEINVRQTWGESFENLGISAIYPIREDFYPGDIYLTVEDPCNGDEISKFPTSVLVGSISPSRMRALNQDAYAARPMLPRVPAETQADKDGNKQSGQQGAKARNKPANASPTNASTPANDAIFLDDGQSRPFTRLRMTAFPTFTVGRVSKVALGATLGAGGGLGRLLGLTNESSSSVRVGISQAEEWQIPPYLMLPAIEKFMRSEEGVKVLDKRMLDSLVMHLTARMLAKQKNNCDAAPTPKISFLNRVFYTRSLDYDFENSNATAVALAAALQEVGRTVKQLPKIPGAPGGGSDEPAPKSTTPGTEANTVPSAAADQDVTKQISAGLGVLAGLGQSGPGVSASLGFGQFGNMILKQQFDRPLAFGADLAYTYALDSVLAQQPVIVRPPSEPFMAPAGGNRPLTPASPPISPFSFPQTINLN